MLKLTAVVSVMLVVTWSQVHSKRHKREAAPGSTLWAATLPCDSCGSECAAACGTRHFRSCCFNYLRRKRDPDVVKMFPQTQQDLKQDYRQNRPAAIVFDNPPEPWITNYMTNDIKPYPYEDTMENRMVMYDI